GVTPYRLAALTFAPVRTSRSAVPRSFRCAARWSGVVPSGSTLCTFGCGICCWGPAAERVAAAIEKATTQPGRNLTRILIPLPRYPDARLLTDHDSRMRELLSRLNGRSRPLDRGSPPGTREDRRYGSRMDASVDGGVNR